MESHYKDSLSTAVVNMLIQCGFENSSKRALDEIVGLALTYLRRITTNILDLTNDCQLSDSDILIGLGALKLCGHNLDELLEFLNNYNDIFPPAPKVYFGPVPQKHCDRKIVDEEKPNEIVSWAPEMKPALATIGMQLKNKQIVLDPSFDRSKLNPSPCRSPLRTATDNSYDSHGGGPNCMSNTNSSTVGKYGSNCRYELPPEAFPNKYEPPTIDVDTNGAVVGLNGKIGKLPDPFINDSEEQDFLRQKARFADTQQLKLCFPYPQLNGVKMKQFPRIQDDYKKGGSPKQTIINSSIRDEDIKDNHSSSSGKMSPISSYHEEKPYQERNTISDEAWNAALQARVEPRTAKAEPLLMNLSTTVTTATGGGVTANDLPPQTVMPVKRKHKRHKSSFTNSRSKKKRKIDPADSMIQQTNSYHQFFQTNTTEQQLNVDSSTTRYYSDAVPYYSESSEREPNSNNNQYYCPDDSTVDHYDNNNDDADRLSSIDNVTNASKCSISYHLPLETNNTDEDYNEDCNSGHIGGGTSQHIYESEIVSSKINSRHSYGSKSTKKKASHRKSHFTNKRKKKPSSSTTQPIGQQPNLTNSDHYSTGGDHHHLQQTEHYANIDHQHLHHHHHHHNQSVTVDDDQIDYSNRSSPNLPINTYVDDSDDDRTEPMHESSSELIKMLDVHDEPLSIHEPNSPTTNNNFQLINDNQHHFINDYIGTPTEGIRMKIKIQKSNSTHRPSSTVNSHTDLSTPPLSQNSDEHNSISERLQLMRDDSPSSVIVRNSVNFCAFEKYSNHSAYDVNTNSPAYSSTHGSIRDHSNLTDQKPNYNNGMRSSKKPSINSFHRNISRQNSSSSHSSPKTLPALDDCDNNNRQKEKIPPLLFKTSKSTKKRKKIKLTSGSKKIKSKKTTINLKPEPVVIQKPFVSVDDVFSDDDDTNNKPQTDQNHYQVTKPPNVIRPTQKLAPQQHLVSQMIVENSVSRKKFVDRPISRHPTTNEKTSNQQPIPPFKIKKSKSKPKTVVAPSPVVVPTLVSPFSLNTQSVELKIIYSCLQGEAHYKSDDGKVVYICPICNTEDNGSLMLACDRCEDWYHGLCLGIFDAPPEDANWFCPRCVEDNLSETMGIVQPSATKTSTTSKSKQSRTKKK